MAEEAAKAAEAPESKSGVNEATAYGLAANLPDGTPTVSRAGEHEPDRVLSGSFFDDEDMVSLDELRAEEGEPAEESSEKKDTASSPPKEEEGKEAKPEAKPEEKKGEEKEGKESKAEEDGKEDGKSDEAAKEEPPSKKPPKGFVPEAALYEERGKRQKLSQEVSQLRREMAGLRTKPAEAPSQEEAEHKAAAADKASEIEKTFTQEAAELEKIDPEENPLDFQKKTFSLLKQLPTLLTATKESVETGYKKEFETREQSAQEEAEFNDAVESGVRLMSHLVPGVNDAETNKALTEFAVNQGGLPVEVLRDLTNPGTIVMSPNGEPRFLKEDAAYLVSMVNKMHQQSQANPALDEMDVKDILSARGDDIRTSLMDEVKEEVQKQVLADLRKKGVLGKKDEGFKPIGELPGSEGNESGVDPQVLYSEAEIARMSDKERMDWLME